MTILERVLCAILMRPNQKLGRCIFLLYMLRVWIHDYYSMMMSLLAQHILNIDGPPSEIQSKFVSRVNEILQQCTIHPAHVPEEIDLTVSGGGGLAIYSIGVYAGINYIREQLQRPSVIRVSGASFGAFMSPCHDEYILHRESAVAKWVNAVSLGHNRFVNKFGILQYGTSMRIVANIFLSKLQALPKNLFISVTELGFPCKNRIKSRMTTKAELVDAMMETICIPPFTGMATNGIVDGGITNNCPIFEDGLRANLVCQISRAQRAGRVKRIHNRDFFTPEEAIFDWIANGCEDTLKFFERNEPVGGLYWSSGDPAIDLVIE